MNIPQLRYVLAVVRARSFSAAAESLYVAQPTLSQQIAALEKELGVELFRRSTRSVIPTDAGLEFARHAEIVLADLSRLEAGMLRYTAEMKGSLRVGLLWSFSYLSIDRMLNEFRLAFPDIHISMVIDGSMKLYEMMENQMLDVAFVNNSNAFNTSIYQFTPISSSRFCAIVSTLDSLSVRDMIRPEDLVGKAVLLPDKNSAIGAYMVEYLKAYSGQINVLGSSSQVDTCINTAAANLGISFITEDIASRYVSEQIRMVPLSPEITRTTGLLTRKQDAVHPLVQAFTETARTCFRLL